ncbi:hypothetical protein GCM10009554_75150 [Kribbella koreensis]|uniref:Uncharacterized protein n=1 Tax=Kribbella koreensis TaxID=57909 RepID=A0ABN1RMX4_9ACTN
MVAFDPDRALDNSVDYRLMMNGFVTLFWSPEVLANTVDWLAEHGYRLARADASTRSTSVLWRRG